MNLVYTILADDFSKEWWNFCEERSSSFAPVVTRRKTSKILHPLRVRRKKNSSNILNRCTYRHYQVSSAWEGCKVPL
jgi:hypothetical protein